MKFKEKKYELNYVMIIVKMLEVVVVEGGEIVQEILKVVEMKDQGLNIVYLYIYLFNF